MFPMPQLPQRRTAHSCSTACTPFSAGSSPTRRRPQRLAHTLWCAHVHAMDAWESTARIAFISPEPASGKTRALEVSRVAGAAPRRGRQRDPGLPVPEGPNAPAGRPTILFDEIDTIFGPTAKDNEEIRGLLNAGHRKGAVAGRCVVLGRKVKTEEIEAYCAVALAGLGGHPRHHPDAIHRSVRMRAAAHPANTLEPYRRRLHKAQKATRCATVSRPGLRRYGRSSPARASPRCRTASPTGTRTCGSRCWRSPTPPAATGHGAHARLLSPW